MRYLKSDSGCSYDKLCLWSVSSIRPAIIGHLTGTPLAFVPVFSGGNIMVKSLSVLMAHFPEIFWEVF
jgi:hypothetical protein